MFAAIASTASLDTNQNQHTAFSNSLSFNWWWKLIFYNNLEMRLTMKLGFGWCCKTIVVRWIRLEVTHMSAKQISLFNHHTLHCCTNWNTLQHSIALVYRVVIHEGQKWDTFRIVSNLICAVTWTRERATGNWRKSLWIHQPPHPALGGRCLQ